MKDTIASRKHAQIVFDDDARRSFLTGFHKRKLARKDQAKKRAQLREKQQRLDSRREHRRELAERAARNAAEVEKAYGMKTESGTVHEWRGEPEAMEEEYEGEEQLATVTVVQDFDLSALLHGPPRTRKPAEEVRELKRRTPKVKAARHAEQRKQRARRTEKAERAGRKRK